MRKTSRPPIAFQDGWNIKPDMIIEMPKDFNVPATGTVAYQNILVKVNFPEDVWVLAAEMRAGNRQVLHHGRVLVRRPGMEFMKDAVPGEAYATGSLEMQTGGRARYARKVQSRPGPAGLQPVRVGEVHSRRAPTSFSTCITPRSGRPRRTDRKSVWFLRSSPPKLRYFMHNGPTGSNLAIPAGATNAEVVSEMTAQVDAQLVYLQPHMHLRGKDYELRLVFPTGKTETVFKAKWDFNWQIGYDLAKPIALPKGTRIIGIAHYDNSANNKFNPDPAKARHLGRSELGRNAELLPRNPDRSEDRSDRRCSNRPGPACCRAGIRVRRWQRWEQGSNGELENGLRKVVLTRVLGS